MPLITNHLVFIIAMLVLLAGLHTTIVSNNLVKKLVGLSIFQTAVLFFYISIGYIIDADTPFLVCMNSTQCPQTFSNALTHVLMLTAIVVGIAMTTLGLIIVIRIKEEFGTIEEDELIKKMNKM